MAKSNAERVREIEAALRAGLGPFVLRQYKMAFKGRYLQEIELKLYEKGRGQRIPDEMTALQTLDLQKWLNLIERNWREAFTDKLGRAERSYLNELRAGRNRLHHENELNKFSNEDAYRVADTAGRVLEAIGATKEAEAPAEHARELLRVRYEREAKQSQKQPVRMLDGPLMTRAGLKPWRQVVEPHPDVQSGRYVQAQFAANLSDVLSGAAAREYGVPSEFFRRTYMTEGLLQLMANGIRRLTGQGGDPVVQLQTNFGGGKTHSMLALYHAFGCDFKLRELPDYDDIIELVGDIDDDLVARRAVIVGTSFNVSQPRQKAECSTRTIWGEIAYQLGGARAYELVEQNDLDATNPGADTLVELLDQYGPALIIIDELVRLAQNLYRREDKLAAGSFDAVLSFVQSLTEAVTRSRNALLLVSVPESEIETGGEGGQRALEFLRQTLGRLQLVWKPIEQTESYEIVRRRLFSEVETNDFAARDAVVNAFHDMYRRGKTDYPRDAAEENYRQKMTQTYPIHPELFERLYGDWSTLERFQRTRGVLRLMAEMIYRLWINDDQALLIMPGSLPLFAARVKNEIVQYLPENFPAIVDTDIDGENSTPFQLDRAVTQLGKHQASRRVARAVFIGSAPSVAEQHVRGVEEVRINLATVQPGERTSIFGDALRRMSNQLTYLYNDGTRYWYDTRPTVNRTAADRAQSMDDYKVLEEAGKRLREQQWDRRVLGSVHFLPESSAEIPDEQSVRVVVLGPEYTHKSNDSASAAMREIDSIMTSRGNSPRHHRNMLVFIAPDDTRNAEWAASIRKYLAWKSIERDAATLNLDHQQNTQAQEAIKREGETVDEQLQETYSWLIVPLQPNGNQPVSLSQERLSGKQPFLERAARKLKNNEWLIQGLSPDNLLMELEPLNIWEREPHLRIKTLWEWLTKYCYLPRLFDYSVLEATIVDGVSRLIPAFAYATGINEQGKYTGLTMGRQFTLYFDDKALIVQPDAARKQLEAERAAQERDSVSAPSGSTPAPAVTTVDDADDAPAPPKPKTRYYGSVQIDPQRAMRDLSQIADEIIVRLASVPGADLRVTVEIEGMRGDGFDDATVRTISENSRTLNFNSHDFEE